LIQFHTQSFLVLIARLTVLSPTARGDRSPTLDKTPRVKNSSGEK
jgi:hypothetical protein